MELIEDPSNSTRAKLLSHSLMFSPARSILLLLAYIEVAFY